MLICSLRFVLFFANRSRMVFTSTPKLSNHPSVLDNVIIQEHSVPVKGTLTAVTTTAECIVWWLDRSLFLLHVNPKWMFLIVWSFPQWWFRNPGCFHPGALPQSTDGSQELMWIRKAEGERTWDNVWETSRARTGWGAVTLAFIPLARSNGHAWSPGRLRSAATCGPVS